MCCNNMADIVAKDFCLKFNAAFKISTKYTAAVMFVLMCISLGNQLRIVKINCRTNGFDAEEFQQNRSDYDAKLDDFCWNQGTFLVAKALEPQMRSSVKYPGVYDYDREADELIQQNYYKRTWMLFVPIFVMSSLIYLVCKMVEKKRVEDLSMFRASENDSAQDLLVKMYLQTVGHNDAFAYSYVLYKTLATLSLLAQWAYLSFVIGGRFMYYGVATMNYYRNNADVWPKPADALFPKVANCDLGYWGDLEMKTAQCRLPMNDVNQWLFSIYWFWVAVVSLVNLLSFPFVMLDVYRFLRLSKFSKYVRASNIGSKERDLEMNLYSNEPIIINLSFGDWLVHKFIERNVSYAEYMQFIRSVAVIRNKFFQPESKSIS